MTDFEGVLVGNRNEESVGYFVGVPVGRLLVSPSTTIFPVGCDVGAGLCSGDGNSLVHLGTSQNSHRLKGSTV